MHCSCLSYPAADQLNPPEAIKKLVGYLPPGLYFCKGLEDVHFYCLVIVVLGFEWRVTADQL